MLVHCTNPPLYFRLLQLGIDDFVSDIEGISESASKEWSIEKSLNTMKEEWSDKEYSVTDYKGTGTYIIQGPAVDEVQALLDDHIVKTQTMRNSQYAVPFAERMKAWESFLITSQDLLDSWTKVQSTWMYLEPIFGSDDIQKQMPTEAKNFETVDHYWREIMSAVHDNMSCEVVANIPNILERLDESNKLLDEIQKGLNSYLETKRKYFPRFFFLSNDELLEILAETKEPRRVQPFLRKCFDGLNALDFSDSLDILAMKSSHGERIPMIERINPTDFHGAVEQWLLEVERVMGETLKEVIRNAMFDYKKKARTQWVQDWPTQVVLNISQLYFTSDFERNIRDNGFEAVEDFAEELNGYVEDTVKLIRGNLPKLIRKTLSALTVLDVHARDVTRMLAKAQVSSEYDFDWQSQLRYTWEEDTLMVKMINSVLEYGYEYLGNAGRLVITPLTDRCYRTLMGAVHLQYGGAPEGPAGTGKTETVKDLAKSLARNCVVYNCSDQLDYLAMAKFFKGLASSGSWCCFDEFNRITLEVLSVVAQQIITIQQAIAAQKTSFVFSGTELSLKWTCSVFITMNPGYAGRAELPDNLKALFRTVAMMIPDYVLIAEILLYSFGYKESRSCAVKIYTTYKLCSEQLSSQSHYDYGMRAVISVLKAASNLKRKFMDEDESILVLRAIRDVNAAKFLSQDLVLFNGITSDLFPGVELPEADYNDMLMAMKEQIAKHKLQPHPAFIDKVIQTYEMMLVRHGFMIVGRPFSGKSECWKVLRDTLGVLGSRGQMPCNMNAEHELETKTYVINPKSITMGQLYGCFDEVSHEWSDGILAITYRKAANDTSDTRKWVVFDGPVDAIWIENMNTVLDDNKKLCLMSGEMLAMSDYMNMLFEPMDLLVASPATVSRCGMIYMEPEQLGWKPHLMSWLDDLPKCVAEDQKCRDLIIELFDWMVPPALKFLRKGGAKVMIKIDDVMKAVNLMRVMKSLMYPELADDSEMASKMTTKEITCWLEPIFLYSLVWSIGITATLEGRKSFDKFFRELLNGDIPEYPKLRKLALMFPKNGSVYDFCFEKEGKGRWRLWKDTMDSNFTVLKGTKFNEIVVPTVDTTRYTYMLDAAIAAGNPLLFIGPTGTGKSVYVNKKLNSGLDKEKFKTILLGFSAQTSANQTQDIIDGKLDKRRKGIYGPPLGKRCVIFVDDLNMPQVEEYGAQPPIELLRQAIDNGGWYDRKEKSFRKLVDVQFVTAMGTASRNQVTPRMLRHLNVIGMTKMASESMKTIYSFIMNWYFTGNDFPENIVSSSQRIVAASMEIFESSCDNLLPTPSKSHYTFNLRDYARVIQGVMLMGVKKLDGDKDRLIRLWAHEVMRVFSDRLVNDEDRKWFLDTLRDVVKKTFGSNFDNVFMHLDNNHDRKVDTIEEVRGLLFGDYLVPGADPRLYEEITDSEHLQGVMDGYLDEYNAVSTKPMNLVMFKFAIEHASRIARVLKIPGGNVLLVGVGGSGRQSLTRLAAYMGEYKLIQIEIAKNYGLEQFREDIKKVLLSAGVDGERTVFLFSDTQIQEETFVEDINNILNTGEIPNLFAPDELGMIGDGVRSAAKAEGKKLETMEESYQYFLSRVRENLHIVLAFSYIGDAFRKRLREFPSLVNCCTIDWFTQWPDDALVAVASNFLEDVEMDQDIKTSEF